MTVTFGRPYSQRPQPAERRESPESAIDRIFRAAERTQQQPPQPGKGSTMTGRGNLSDLHNSADVARRIAGLEQQGITQLTDPAKIKEMKPAEIVAAQREGRLLQYMTGITAPASDS